MPQSVTKLYAKKMYLQVCEGLTYNKSEAVMKSKLVSLLEDFFAERVEEFERQLDTIAGTVPAQNLAEVKARSGKTNMKVPQ